LVHRDLNGLADDVGIAANLRIEERLADDLERELHHRLRDVDTLVLLPAVGEARSTGRHCLRVAHDALVGERRCEQLPLLVVKLTLARQEPVAEDRTHEDGQSRRFFEGRVTRDEHLVGERGRAHDDEVPDDSHRDLDDLGMGSRQPKHHSDPVLPKGTEMPDHGVTGEMGKRANIHPAMM